MDEKQRRKALLTQVKQAEQAKQEAALPLAKADLKALFDHLDAMIETKGCDHSLRCTQAFLNERHLPAEAVISWLQGYGGYCDCEVLANVEETWGERVGSMIA